MACRPCQARAGFAFCLYVGLVAPHFPLVAPEEFYARYAQMQLPEPKLSTDAPDFRNHPWIALQDKQMSSESKFKDADERRATICMHTTRWSLGSIAMSGRSSMPSIKRD